MTIHIGQTFFNQAVGQVARHLWIVASEVTNEARFVFVNLSTKPSGASPECVVEKHEHGSLSAAKSFVRSDRACLTELSRFEEALKGGLFQQSADVSDALLKKVQAALLASPLTRREVIGTLRAQGLLRP